MRLGVRAALWDGVWIDGDVEVVDGLVAELGLPGGARTGLAVPGFVDLQINGFAGVDFRRSDPSGYTAAAAALGATGTTAVLPTFYSSSIEEYAEALRVLGAVRDDPPPGPRILGAHLEGPFLSRSWAGAHDPARLVDPDPAVLERLVAAGPIQLMTVAPELPGALELVGRLRAWNVRVSMGHTDADAAAARRGAAAGIEMLTHCWNAHRRFAPRDPGPAAVALLGLAPGLICDRVHVADETLLLTFAAAGERVCVVTAAVAPAGTDATRWDIDGVSVFIGEGRAQLADGTLAGSVVTMDRSLRNLVDLGVAPEVALRAMSTNPARLAGLPRHDLSVGSPADVAVLDDDWRVTRTLVGGVEIHSST